jgi:Zn-dependent protease with chaperone function
MHLSLILCAVGIACSVRLFLPTAARSRSEVAWANQWQHTLGLFLFSPLLLLVMAVAVLQMGKAGRMLGLPVGEIGFSCALSFLGLAVGCLCWQWGQAWHSIQKLRQQPTVDVQNMQNTLQNTAQDTAQDTAQTTTGYVLETDLPFAAQVGFWRSQLVISRGLLMHLSAEHVAAVLTHEQAHAYYRDTFWFFWLGWLRQLTAWLPNTERLWQELLLLREMRADRWAAEQVDALLIAEALLQMSQFPCLNLENSCAAMGSDISLTRLEERIEALLAAEGEPRSAGLNGSNAATPVQSLPWLWLLFTLMPLSTVALHH